MVLNSQVKSSEKLIILFIGVSTCQRKTREIEKTLERDNNWHTKIPDG